MEKIKSKQTDGFKAKVQRILYADTNTSSSADDSDENPQNHTKSCTDLRTTVTEQLDNNVELLHKYEEYISRQLSVVRKMRQKGIITVSSKQSVSHDLVESNVPEDHPELCGEGTS